MTKEFKNTYAKSGVEYQKASKFSPAGIANSFFPKGLNNLIKRKIDEHREIVQKDIWQNFNGCTRVLDIGCGEGEFLRYAPKKIKAEGIEIIEDSIKKCRGLGLKVTKADIEKKSPFKNNSFDGIIMAHVIEHLNHPEEVIVKIRKMLKDKGKVVILTPNFSVYHKEFYDDPTHKRPFTKQSLFRILYDHGFREIKLQNDVMHKTNSLLSLLVLFPKTKFMIEKLLGSMCSPYMMAVAVCNKK